MSRLMWLPSNSVISLFLTLYKISYRKVVCALQLSINFEETEGHNRDSNCTF